MSEPPKYVLEFMELTEPDDTAFDTLLARLKARGYEPTFAMPLAYPDGTREAFIMVGKLKGESP